MNKIVNGQVIDITGTPEETAILAEWADNAPGTGPKWTADQLAALLALRNQAKAVFADLAGDTQALAKATRGLALVTLDEVNNLREWIAAFKVEVAAATNLADLQSRVAGLPAMPDRTIAQLKTAIQGKIDAGNADS
jgi:hypothetical protein